MIVLLRFLSFAEKEFGWSLVAYLKQIINCLPEMPGKGLVLLALNKQPRMPAKLCFGTPNWKSSGSKQLVSTGYSAGSLRFPAMIRSIFFSAFFIVIWSITGWAQSFTLLTWNIQDLGRTKDASEINVMVQVMRDADLVLIQEVVAKDPAGAQKVALIADELNRTGARWDYRISDPTNSPSAYISERYAILWKPSRLQLEGRAFLDAGLAVACDREPFLARFKIAGDTTRFWVVNFHARRFDNRPELEIRHFIDYPRRLGSPAVIIAGDFNLDEDHDVWRPFYERGYQAVLNDSPTTLKRSCNRQGEYVNYPIDNIYWPKEIFSLSKGGWIDTVGSCDNLEAARGVSDHLPVWADISLATP